MCGKQSVGRLPPKRAPKNSAISVSLDLISLEMSTYPRLQGYEMGTSSLTPRKRGKKYQEKKRKQREKKLKVYRDDAIDTSQFMGVDYEDSIFIPESLQHSDADVQAGYHNGTENRTIAIAIRH